MDGSTPEARGARLIDHARAEGRAQAFREVAELLRDEMGRLIGPACTAVSDVLRLVEHAAQARARGGCAATAATPCDEPAADGPPAGHQPAPPVSRGAGGALEGRGVHVALEVPFGAERRHVVALHGPGGRVPLYLYPDEREALAYLADVRRVMTGKE
jgi:hypothetical protein